MRVAIILVVLFACLVLIWFSMSLVRYYRDMAVADKVVNQVVKRYLVGKKGGLSIDEIEEQLALENGFEILEPFSHHLEREFTIGISESPQGAELTEIMVLQRIAYDICCARGVYPKPIGKTLNPLELRCAKFVGGLVTRRLEEWRGAGA